MGAAGPGFKTSNRQVTIRDSRIATFGKNLYESALSTSATQPIRLAPSRSGKQRRLIGGHKLGTTPRPVFINFGAPSTARSTSLRAGCRNAIRDSSIATFGKNLFEQLSQILKHGVFFLRARAIREKELLAQVQCLSLRCWGTKPIPYRSQELISVHLTFSCVPRKRTGYELLMPNVIGERPESHLEMLYVNHV